MIDSFHAPDQMTVVPVLYPPPVDAFFWLATAAVLRFWNYDQGIASHIFTTPPLLGATESQDWPPRAQRLAKNSTGGSSSWLRQEQKAGRGGQGGRSRHNEQEGGGSAE